ncbi:MULTISPECIES: YfhO family protein [unclassified Jeotgalibaca]|uniref:YfhO family protein n=1 Tax=unclassified Jeotgalibaca TaxID=2621505 RepID=UPI003FD4CE2E
MSLNLKSKYSPKMLLLLSFGLPFIIMTIIYMAMGVYPAGKETLLTIDLAQQYVDFFSYYRHTLLNEPQALFYSFAKGIGGEMTGLWSYYLNSPFNILMLLFPQRLLPVGITLLILIKIASSGLSFGYLLLKKFQGKDLLVPLFSLSYALMGYVIVNQLHVMWLDSLVFLPLIVLGLEKIVDGERGYFYSLTLGLALFSQYYLTYMICLFLILYFPFALMKQKYTAELHSQERAKFYWNRFWKFSIYSLLGAGTAAFSLIPNFVSLLGGKASHTSEILDWRFKYPFPEILSKFYIGAFDFDQLPSGLPNIFIGTVALVSFLYYLINPKFAWKERLAALAMTLFFIFSMNVDILNKAWHAFQNPAWYPYRFSFVVCFFFILNGFRSMNQTKKFPLWFAITLLVGQTASAFYVLEKNFSFLEPLQVLVTALFLVLFLVLFLLRETDYNWLPLVMLVMTVIEMSANATIDLVRLGYVDMAPLNDYQSVLNNMLDDIKPGEDEFYRIEKTFQRSKNDSFQANYPSVSHFSSTFEAEVPALFGRLGFPESSFVISYSTGTLITDAFFGVRYYAENKPISDDLIDNDSYYHIRPNANRPDFAHYHPYSESLRTKTYENPNAFSLGFTVPTKMKTVELLDGQPMANQEKIMRALYSENVNEPFFTKENIDSIITQNIATGGNEEINKTYTKENLDKPAFIELQFTTQSEEPYYLVLDSRIDEDNADFRLNGESFPYYKSYRTDQIFNLASGSENESVQFSIELKEDLLTLRDLNLFRLNLSQFNKVMADIEDNQMTIDSFSQTNIEGNVTADSTSSVLMFTIPYSKGWSVSIDGVPSETYAVLDSLLAVDIPPGNHSVRLTYRTPYLWVGIATSVASLIILLILDKKKYRSPF